MTSFATLVDQAGGLVGSTRDDLREVLVFEAAPGPINGLSLVSAEIEGISAVVVRAANTKATVLLTFWESASAPAAAAVSGFDLSTFCELRDLDDLLQRTAASRGRAEGEPSEPVHVQLHREGHRAVLTIVYGCPWSKMSGYDARLATSATVRALGTGRLG